MKNCNHVRVCIYYHTVKTVTSGGLHNTEKVIDALCNSCRLHNDDGLSLNVIDNMHRKQTVSEFIERNHMSTRLRNTLLNNFDQWRPVTDILGLDLYRFRNVGKATVNEFKHLMNHA